MSLGAMIRSAFMKLDNKLNRLNIKEEKDLQTVIRLAGDIVGQVKVKREHIKQEGYSDSLKRETQGSS